MLPPAPLADLIEPVPGVIEHRTFESGELIEWSEGIFLMDPETGQIQGYQLIDAEERAGVYWWQSADVLPRYAVYGKENRWIATGGAGLRVLLDRLSGVIWRLPDHIELIAASQNRLVLRDTREGGVDTLTDTAFKEIGRFEYMARPYFSPDGSRLLFGRGATIYVMDVETSTQTVLFEGAAHEDWGVPDSVWATPRRAGQEILVNVQYKRLEGGEYPRIPDEWYRLNWSGEVLAEETVPESTLPESALAASYAPGGRHVAWQEAAYDIGFYEASEGWPTVVVADAGTGEPILRVRSAALQHHGLGAGWLATGDGLVLRTAPAACGQGRGDAAAGSPRAEDRVASRLADGMRELAIPGRKQSWPREVATATLPRHTPSGSTRPAREMVGLYDSHRDVWHFAVLLSGNRYGDYDYLSPSWGDSSRELRLSPDPPKKSARAVAVGVLRCSWDNGFGRITSQPQGAPIRCYQRATPTG